MTIEKFIYVAFKVFIGLSLVSALFPALNPPAHAQERSRIARIGVLRIDARDSPAAVEAIRDLKHGLSNSGYVEGQNVNFHIRWADDKLDHLKALAAELVRLQSDVIVTGGPQAVRALKESTTTIPIIMGRMDDVVEHGLVTSLAGPGGNITGFSFQTGELSGKWLDLLRQVLPKLFRAAVLWETSGTSVRCERRKRRLAQLACNSKYLKCSARTNSTMLLRGSESSTRKLWSFGIAHLHSATGAIGGSNW
jgi:ABC-type uncharacterized transport system substrate-binding protein